MIRIKERVFTNGLDYILTNGVELYLMDWNGEVYLNGFKNGKDTNKYYKPIFKVNGENILELGFEEC